MKKLLLLLPIGALMCTSSCRETTCSAPDLVLSLHGFDSTAKSTIVLGYCAPGSGFTVLDDTRYFSSIPTDTAEYLFNDSAQIGINPHADNLLTFPVIGKTYKVTGITLHSDRMHTSCTSGYSYYLDDTLHSVPASTGSHAFAPVNIYH